MEDLKKAEAGADAAPDQETGKFRILLCIDGTEESYRGLRYAARLGREIGADIVLLNVRAVGHYGGSTGFQDKVFQDNMLDWGLELPGMADLMRGRDMLMELGDMAQEVEGTVVHSDVSGDPFGNNSVLYRNKQGRLFELKQKVSTNIASGILDEAEEGKFDLVILGAASEKQNVAKSLWDPAVAEKVAVYAPCSVLIVRNLAEDCGHLLCTDGSERAIEAVRKGARFAKWWGCDVSLISVSLDAEGEDEAHAYADAAAATVKELGIPVKETIVRVGNPVREIVEVGADYSLVVLSESGRSAISRFFMGSVAFKVMEEARNSVLIVR